jgi:hypothetical protein
MDRFKIVTNTARVALVGLANLLCACSHRRVTFPITLQASTYVACLECGRHLPYDWSRMRIRGLLMTWLAPPLVGALEPTSKASR